MENRIAEKGSKIFTTIGIVLISLWDLGVLWFLYIALSLSPDSSWGQAALALTAVAVIGGFITLSLRKQKLALMLLMLPTVILLLTLGL